MTTLLSALIDPFLLVSTIGIGAFTRGQTRLILSGLYMLFYGSILLTLPGTAPTPELAIAKFIDAGVILGGFILLVRERVEHGLRDRQG